MRTHVRTSLAVLVLAACCAAQAFAGHFSSNSDLITAAWRGDLAAVKTLLTQGANVDARSRGMTALIASAWGGNVEVTKALLAAGANVNAVDDDGGSALCRAAGTPYTEIVRVLIDVGADVNIGTLAGTPLIQAALNGRVEQVQMLLSHHANVNARNQLGQTALMVAGPVAYRGQPGLQEALATHEEIERLLLAAGADVNAKDNQGRTAIQYQGTKSGVADMLRKVGARE